MENSENRCCNKPLLWENPSELRDWNHVRIFGGNIWADLGGHTGF